MSDTTPEYNPHIEHGQPYDNPAPGQTIDGPNPRDTCPPYKDDPQFRLLRAHIPASIVERLDITDKYELERIHKEFDSGVYPEEMLAGCLTMIDQQAFTAPGYLAAYCRALSILGHTQ